MHNQAYALATGVFLLVLVVALVATGYWLAGTDPERRPYVIVTEGSVAGLSEASQIYFRGVPAGRVERIRINPEDPREIHIRIAVRGDIPVTRGTEAYLRPSGLTGITQVELTDTGEHPEPLPTDPQRPARIAMQPGLLAELQDVGGELLQNLELLITRLNALVDEDNRDRFATLLERADETLAATESLARSMEAGLPSTLDEAQRMLDAFAELAESGGGTLERVDVLLEDARELADVTRRAGGGFESETLPGINRSLERFDRASRELTRLAEVLAREPQSVLHGRQRPAPGPGEE